MAKLSDSCPTNLSECLLDLYLDVNTCSHDSDPHFWSKMLTNSTQVNLQPGPSRLDSDWGFVLQNKHKKEKRNKRKIDVGSNCSAANSFSDLSEALSAISAALSLSSSGSSQREDQDVVADLIRSLKNTEVQCLLTVPSSNDNRNEIQTESNSGAKELTGKDNFLAPAEGMVFSSEEEVYKFYKTYAEETGFSIRKAKVQRRSDGTIRKRYFFCSREGRKESNKKTKYKRKETRIGCPARIECTVENGNWKISRFIQEHNHHLERGKNVAACLTTSKVHVEREAEMSTEAAASKFVESQNLDMHVQDEKLNGLPSEEADGLMKYFKFLKVEDPSFFSAVQLDSVGYMKNFFWSNGSSIKDYSYFGDVLILDTQFKLEKYNMICAPLFGLNHHRKFILFGCALLQDESTDSFIWLFETFKEATDRHQPKTIFTDVSPAMEDAIKEVFPEANHQFGLWHIRRNSAECLSTCYGLPGFEELFNKWVLGCQTEEEFESRHVSLVKQFNLHDNQWLNALYISREKWAPVFTKKTFAVGIQCTASVDGTFQNLATRVASSVQFLKEYLFVLLQQRFEEFEEDLRSKEEEPEIFSNSNLAEQEAAYIYTPTMFKVFQKELLESYFSEIEKLDDGSESMTKFKVIQGDEKQSIVEFNCEDYSAGCSCMKYETVGILCCHVLKVLRKMNVLRIPPQYISRRWTKCAKEVPRLDRLKALS